MTPISSIAVLLTCYNRKENTLQCLEALFEQQGIEVDYAIEVFLVDDGSTDNTAEAISVKFPEVTIISGNGDLFWNRGMYLAWQTAAKTKDFDYYLWLNDDTFLYKEALVILLKQSFVNAIICGATQTVIDQSITYGGYLKNPDRLVIPNGQFQECDFINGNCVLISKKAYINVGMLDPIFHHAVGDFDYGLRAKKLGVNLFVAPYFIGTCESHTSLPKWRSPQMNVIERLKSLYSAASGCYPPQFFVFDRRHNGIFIAVFHYFTIHLRCLFPFLWRS